MERKDRSCENGELTDLFNNKGIESKKSIES